MRSRGIDPKDTVMEELEDEDNDYEGWSNAEIRMLQAQPTPSDMPEAGVARQLEREFDDSGGDLTRRRGRSSQIRLTCRSWSRS